MKFVVCKYLAAVGNQLNSDRLHEELGFVINICSSISISRAKTKKNPKPQNKHTNSFETLLAAFLKPYLT